MWIKLGDVILQETLYILYSKLTDFETPPGTTNGAWLFR